VVDGEKKTCIFRRPPVNLYHHSQKHITMYKGSDLPDTFRQFFKREKTKITKILKAKGCTDIKLDYGFHYFSGFYTAPDGQIWYLFTPDKRYFGYEKIIYRTAKHYKDYSGGINCEVSTKELEKLPPV
jgi:hypothetical protein